MDIFSFLTVILVAGCFGWITYVEHKDHKEIVEKLTEKLTEKTVVTLPWEQTIDNPDAQVTTDDQIPLEELDEDELKKNMGHMFTAQEDKEAEEAQKEIN